MLSKKAFFIRQKSVIFKIEEDESEKEVNMGPKRTKWRDDFWWNGVITGISPEKVWLKRF